jgi:hypothetical protein
VGAVYPITTYARTHLGDFPHMAKRDLAVWVAWLKTAPEDFLAFSYDVALGGRVLDLPDASPAELLGWQYSTAVKIDAVGWMGNQVWIFEVRPEATVGTFGAAVCYALLAKRDALTELPIVPAIVCNSIQLDVEWCCRAAGVQVLIVPA